MIRHWTPAVSFGITVIGLSATVELLHPLPLMLSVLVMMVWGVWLGWTEGEKREGGE